LKDFEEEIKQTRANHEKFAKAFMQNSIPMGLTTLKEGRFVDVSDVFLRLMGLKRNEVIGNTSIGIGFITEEQRTIFFNELNKKGRIENLELQVRIKGGELRYGLFNAVMMTLSNEKYLLTAMTDITEYKRLKEELKISEERYRKIFEDVPIGLWQSSLEGSYLRANKHLANILGYDSPEDLIQSVTDIGTQIYATPEDRDEATRILRDNGFFENFERQFRKKDGHYVWGSLNARTVRDAKGNILYFEGSSKDITEQKLSEEALRESEATSRALINAPTDSVLLLDARGLILDLNEIATERLGKSRDELVGNLADDYLAENIAKKRRSIISKIFETGREVRFEDERDGNWYDTVAYPITDIDGTVSRIAIIARDITERKQAEKMLRKSEEKYRAVLENASDAILLADEHGKLIEANRMAKSFFGYPRKELLQMHYTQLHPKMELERTIAAFEDNLAHGKGYLQKGIVLRKDGTTVPVDITTTVVEYDGRRLLQASFRDISEHKRTEDSLEIKVWERTVELSEKNKQLVEENKERKLAETALRRKTKELHLHSDKLQEMNAALKVLLKQREEDKTELEEKVMANVKELLLPYLENLKKCRLDDKGKVQVSIIDANLKNIISPFTHRLSSKYSGFTPREIQVANLIRQGKSTKDIAELMGISRSAINIYRNQIRHKLGIISKKINLRSHLMSFS